MKGADMQQFWNDRARENAVFFVDNRLLYDDPNLERFWARGEEGLDHLLEDMEVAVAGNDTVVEIGCGVGRLTRVLARRADHVLALDVSDEMLARAREYNPELENVEWIRGDGTTLTGIPDAEVDACVSTVVFQHMPDPAITLGYVREIGRVLRPGGWAAIQVSNDPSAHRPRGGTRLGARIKQLLRRAPRGQDNPAWLGSAVDLDELERTAEDAGLRMEKVTGAGQLFCQVRLRRPSPGGTPGPG